MVGVDTNHYALYLAYMVVSSILCIMKYRKGYTQWLRQYDGIVEVQYYPNDGSEIIWEYYIDDGSGNLIDLPLESINGEFIEADGRIDFYKLQGFK